MSTEFISPIGRLVQGSVSLETKNDPQTQKPKLDDNGQPIKECFISLAIRKDDPGLPAFYGLFVAAARAEFPHLFDAQGNCTHPQFAWKIQDGDGVDSSGQSVANKPGFAGHWIFKMGTRYLPKAFHAGKYDPSQQIQNPSEVIKRGYFIRVAGSIRGNGVSPQDRQQKPGLFVSPSLIELVAFGEEIQSGPDASKVFGGAAPIGALPPGASAVPVGAPSGLAAPPLPGATPAMAAPPLPGAAQPAIGSPPLPGATPAMAAPPLPGAASPAIGSPPLLSAAAQRFIMQPSAMGATREQLYAQGWTDDMLIQHGHMVKVG